MSEAVDSMGIRLETDSVVQPISESVSLPEPIKEEHGV